ncbi:hypothetical protein [Sporosalibacterium faouarense]|uniref:hypothetical protein n=1 Tax=Sporosalibacterium faouarense TaxID=516123 RepID=UPI00141C7151|nr:hypothetical protein [Sporosalibacterium faouarense]MTI48771.1 hypothetical protein [Bacillota bacterium]
MLVIIEKLIIFFIEPFLMIGAGLGVTGNGISKGKMASISAIYSLLTYGIRTFYKMRGIPLGTHTIILCISLVIMLILIGKKKALDSTIAVLFSLGLIVLGEGVFLFPLIDLLHINLAVVLGKPGMTIGLGLMSEIPLIIAFILCYIFKITIIDLNYFKEAKRM